MAPAISKYISGTVGLEFVRSLPPQTLIVTGRKPP